MNSMHVQEVRRVGRNRLEYVYTVAGEWSKYFEPANPMWVEYSQPVDGVPDSVAVLPLIGNVIVLASLMDADIYVEEIDRDFYECIEEFLGGFDEIMPDHVHFKRRDIVRAGRIFALGGGTEREENLLFFSGGVDATFSLISHLEEKPALVTIWGADIPWDREESWNQALGFNQEVADRYDLKMLTIHSNFRAAFCNDYIEEFSYALVKDWWWPAFHHSVAMMCLAAPISCGKRRKLYFGSTYSAKDHKEWGSYINASDPQVDNHVRFCGLQVVHDGYAFTRYEKVKKICEFYDSQEVKPYLRVCYHSNEGINCGICEKCARAIMSILLAGSDPRAYGFQYDEDRFAAFFAAGIQEVARSVRYEFLAFYTDIQAAFRDKYSAGQVPPVLRLFYETELETLADFLNVPNNECIAMDKAAKKEREQLYRQIGQLQWKLETCEQSGEERLRGLSEDLNRANREKQRLEAEAYALSEQKRALEERLLSLERSRSWRITRPLRSVGQSVRKIKARVSGTQGDKVESGVGTR